MVCEFGMSSFGPVAFRRPGPWDEDRGVGYSEATARRVDDEIRDLVMKGYETARQVVARHRTAVAALAEELLRGRVARRRRRARDHRGQRRLARRAHEPNRVSCNLQSAICNRQSSVPFTPASQSTHTLMGVPGTSSTTVFTRNRWPSRATA